MASYITVYLQSQLEELSIEQTKKGISTADWWTLAEGFDIEEEEVDIFMSELTWQKQPIQFSIPSKRPVQIKIINRLDAVNEEINEIRQKAVPTKVQSFCDKVQSIVIIEMGFSQTKTMFEVVAFEVAYWLSEVYVGLIQSTDDLWYDYDKNRWKPIK